MHNEVIQCIEEQGFRIEGGPYFKVTQSGDCVVRIRTTLNKERLQELNIQFEGDPRTPRSVRFLVSHDEEGSFIVKHITSSGRKKLSADTRRKANRQRVRTV